MKKIITMLLIAVVLTLSAIAAVEEIVLPSEVNAPLNAAKFPSYASKTADNGTVGLTLVDSALSSAKDVWSVDPDTADFITEFTDTAVFDAVAKFVTPKPISGFILYTFFNPEIVMPIKFENNSIYDLYTSEYDLVCAASNVGKITTDYMASYAKYLENKANPEVAADYLAKYNTSFDDGSTTAVYSGSADFNVIQLKNLELARWAFKLTNPDSNNWYRTKLYLDYYDGSFANASQVKLYPAVSDAVYYINPNYEGPKFDIVGAMQRNAGELRFGSVYFFGDNHFDNEAYIYDAGIVCYPSELLEDQVLTLDTPGALPISATGYYEKDEEKMVYTVVLTDVPEDMYITAKSYITYKDKETGEKVTVYSDPIARNYETASATEMK